METRGILVATVTIYCGLYYLTGHLGELTKLIFFVIIVASNIYFLIYWIYHFSRVGIALVVVNVPVLNRKFGQKSYFENDDLIEKPLSKGCYLDEDVKVYSLSK
mmetsp:Transcript_1572/g.164  ORF Transcript_1572/g.164 Transcript_1572/m.164 type:complete len:104 (+) Transcript_1572:232-543(+)